MAATCPVWIYRGRRAVRIENEALRLTVLEEGGHIAEILDKASGVNPLWTPPWPSMAPSRYDRARHPKYGGGVDAALLAGIMGHNLCLDIFGGPSDAEAAAGLPVHGEASLVRYEIESSAQTIVQSAKLSLANLRVERRLQLAGRSVLIERERGEPVRRGSPGWVDAARHARAAVSPERRHRIPRLGVALEGVRASVWHRRLSRARRRVRLAACAPRPTAAQPTSGGRAGPQRRAPIRLTSWISGGRRHFSSHFRRRLGSLSAMSGGARIFPGLAFGRKTPADRRRPGMARPSPAGWSSAPLPFPRRVVR